MILFFSYFVYFIIFFSFIIFIVLSGFLSECVWLWWFYQFVRVWANQLFSLHGLSSILVISLWLAIFMCYEDFLYMGDCLILSIYSFVYYYPYFWVICSVIWDIWSLYALSFFFFLYILFYYFIFFLIYILFYLISYINYLFTYFSNLMFLLYFYIIYF